MAKAVKPEATKPAPSGSTRESPQAGPAVKEPSTALSLPPREGFPAPSLKPSVPDDGGGLRRGRGGIEGEPIPLDTHDPRYTDYFEKVRRQVRSHWIYPREAGERGIGGQLIIDFAIAKSGHLTVIELQRSSGVSVLDLYALNAIKLAQPFPPVPDSVARGALAIRGIFTYQIVDRGLLNQYLR